MEPAFRVAWQDRWLLAADKPAGLPTQAARGGGDNLFDRLRAARPYVGLHHRLDTPVSGLVLFTLDPSVNRAMSEAFRTHAVARTYLAVAVGEVSPGRWDRPVDGKPAVTEVEVLGTGAGFTALRLRPRTGRHHQLRVHAALAGTPLAGDRVHGGASARDAPRLALHAAELAFDHPVTGARIELSSPWPEALAALWARAVLRRAPLSTEDPPAG